MRQISDLLSKSNKNAAPYYIKSFVFNVI